MLAYLISLGTLSGPTPPPVVTHHTIVSKMTAEIDLSAVGQPSQSFVLSTVGYLTVTISDTVGGKIAHVVVDSSRFDGGQFAAMMPPAMTASAQGAVYHVYVRNGRPTAPIVPVPTTVQANQLVQGIELLLSGLRSTRVAESWVDSTASDPNVGAADDGAKLSRTTNWTSKAGEGGQIESDGTWTGTTTTTMGGGAMVTKVSGTAHLSGLPGAVARSASITGSGPATMNLGGQAIPMKVTTDVTAATTP